MRTAIFVSRDVSRACADVKVYPRTAFQIPHDEGAFPSTKAVSQA